ncbi:putative Receptor-type guanylate cyclase gcy-19 [Hypsibius exemplaris]|uniref:Receptor-type guanylate cyclase gcy-19 n=1 Tax=Hypsibius exemplaris TaxID=2072580 RepID=A0A9X6RPQ3_HYPEX|nr:putative Receptor-type guanylate cyclase gcy-19 [Hypsibius exemplaris]
MRSNPFLLTKLMSVANPPAVKSCPDNSIDWPKISIGFRVDRYLTNQILTRTLWSMADQMGGVNPFKDAWTPSGLQTGQNFADALKKHFGLDVPYVFQSKNVGLGLYGWMTATPYSIIVAPQEDVEKFGISTAMIQNRDSEWTTCNEASIKAAMDTMMKPGPDRSNMITGSGNVYMVNLAGPNVYPLLSRSYIGVTLGQLGQPFDPKDPSHPTFPDCDSLAAAVRFINWLIDDSEGAPAPQILVANYVVLQKPKNDWYRYMLDRMATYRCGDRRQMVQFTVASLDAQAALYTTMHQPLTWGFIIGGIVVGLIIASLVASYVYTYVNRLRKESMEMYTIPNKEIRITPTLLSPVDRYKGVVASRKVVDRHIPTASLQCLSTGTWGEHEVFLRPCSLVLHKLKHAAKMRVLELVEISHHKNVVTFYGLTEMPNGRCLVCNFCPFGDLRTLIIAKKYSFTMNIKFSIAGDIAEGMKYLHSHSIIHGNLRSCAVYVEANWAAKVSDYEYDTLHQMQGSFHPTVCQLKKRLNLYQQTSLYPWLYWTSPEILQQGITGREIPPEKSADIYSFGIVCSEIFSMEPAYQKYQELPYKLTPAQILNGILTADMRPREDKHASTTPRCVLRVMEHCWQDDAPNRPGFNTLSRLFRSVNSMRRHFSDRIMIAAAKSSVAVKRRLDDADSRLSRFDSEFHKLSRVLVPAAHWRSIYKQKLYMSMTRHQMGIIFYCNLVEYKSLTLNEQRMEKAIECINLLHQGFENLIEKGGRVYRVYRNGASFVALGNVPYGVKEDPIDSIAQLAFDFLTWAWRVKVPANLMDGFQLQIGIHSGKMAAGTLKYSTSQFFPIGPVQKEAWAIARSSAPCRILISEEFPESPSLGEVFIQPLDDIFLLDPENIEALARWYAKRGEKKADEKGHPGDEQVQVVARCRSTYAAMTAGGTQYQVDLTPEEDKKKANSPDNLRGN